MHHTTRKYFEDEKHHPEWLAAARGTIASVCLTYVSFTVFGVGSCRDDEELESRMSEYPFLGYASQHWGNHARDDHDQTPEVKELALKFLKDDALVNSSNQVMNLPEQRYPGYSQQYTRDVNGLHLGASFGLASIVQSLIEDGADTMEEDEEGRTALHRAAENGHSVVIPILLKHGADVDATNLKFGQTPLHLAALHGHKEVVQTLLERGANTNIKDDDEWMAIHVAAWTGKEEVVRLLLGKTDVNETGKNGLTALHCAAAQGHKTVASLLVEKDADINAKDSGGWTPLHWASKKRHDMMNPRLITIKDRPSQLLRQIASQQKELQVLVQQQTIVFQDKVSTIRGKLSNWHGKLAWLPPQIGLDVEGDYRDILTTLDLASNMQYSGLTLLKTSGEKEETPGPAQLIFAIQDELTALHCVTECEHEGVAWLLLENRADIEEKCDAQLEFDFIDVAPTALHLAAFSDHEVMVRMLLEGGADIHAGCETDIFHGLTGGLHTELNPLQFATVSGNDRVMQLLIERGADIHAICQSRIQSRHFELTSLHLAVLSGDVRVVELLLSNKVDINARCQMKLDIGETGLEQRLYIQADLTPVHLATLLGQFSIIKILLENHADVQMKIQLSMGPKLLQLTALHIALVYNRKETVHLLLQYGADAKTTLLLSKGSKVCAEITALHLISLFQDAEMMQLLIEKGVDVNAKCQISSDNCERPQQTAGGKTTGEAETTEKEASEVTPEQEPGLMAQLFNALLSERAAGTPLLRRAVEAYEKSQGNTVHAELTMVHLVALYGNDEMLKVLFENKADPNAHLIININDTYVDITVSPLHLAVIRGDKNLALLMLASGANASAKLCINLAGWLRIEVTPLQLAVISGNEEMVQVILEHGADSIHLECRFTMDWIKTELTALHLAVLLKHERITALLLNYQADVNEKLLLSIGKFHIQSKAIHLATAIGNVGVVQLLLDNGSSAADIFKFNNDTENIVTPIHLAAILKHDEVMRLFIKNQANLSINCRIKLDPWFDIHLSVLHLVAIGGNMDMMQLLVAEGSDAHMKGSLRCAKFHVDLVDLTVLHLAAMWGHQRGMEQLLEAKCDIDAKFQIIVHTWLQTELSVLHVAALYDHEGIVQLLLDKGPDVNSKIQIRCPHNAHIELTVLNLACVRNDERMAKALLDHGANADSRCEISTPKLNISINSLHLAAASRNERIMYLLLSTTSLNERPSSSSSPSSSLEKRSRLRSEEIIDNRSIEKLNERTSKADPNAMFTLNVGNTIFELNAVHIAALAGSMQMTQLLCDNGADVNVLFEANSKNKHFEFTALHLAVLGKSQSMVQYLLENKADVDAKFRVVVGGMHAEFSPLHLAVLCRNSPGIPALLLEKKPNLEAKCHIGINRRAKVKLTLLHLGALLGQDSIAGLLGKGMNVHTKFLVNVKVCVNLELSALQLASVFHNELLSLLIEVEDEQTRAKVQPHIHAKQLALLFAAVSGHQKLTNLILSAMSDVDEAFTIGIEANLETAFAIPVQADTNATFNVKIEVELCLLHIAAVLGSVGAVTLLVKKGANLEARCKVKIGDDIYAEFAALHLAAIFNHQEVVFLLLQTGADVEAMSKVSVQRTVQTGLIASHLATLLGLEGFLRFLKKEIDIEAKIQAQLTALHLAALLDNDDVAWSLFYHGADANAICLVNVEAKTQGSSNTNIEARLTALHIVAGAEHERMVQLLIEKGANVNLAFQVKGMAIVDYGAQIHRNIKAGGTALHMVAGLGNERIVQMLIDSGVDVDVKSQDGRTALKWSRIHGHDEVAQLILERRAQIKKEGEKNRFRQQLQRTFSKDGPSSPNKQKDTSQDQGDESQPPKENQYPKENIPLFLKRFVVQKAERLGRMQRGLLSKFTPLSFVKENDLSGAQNQDSEPLKQTDSESSAVD